MRPRGFRLRLWVSQAGREQAWKGVVACPRCEGPPKPPAGPPTPGKVQGLVLDRQKSPRLPQEGRFQEGRSSPFHVSFPTSLFQVPGKGLESRSPGLGPQPRAPRPSLQPRSSLRGPNSGNPVLGAGARSGGGAGGGPDLGVGLGGPGRQGLPARLGQLQLQPGPGRLSHGAAVSRPGPRQERQGDWTRRHLKGGQAWSPLGWGWSACTPALPAPQPLTPPLDPAPCASSQVPPTPQCRAQHSPGGTLPVYTRTHTHTQAHTCQHTHGGQAPQPLCWLPHLGLTWAVWPLVAAIQSSRRSLLQGVVPGGVSLQKENLGSPETGHLRDYSAVGRGSLKLLGKSLPHRGSRCEEPAVLLGLDRRPTGLGRRGGPGQIVMASGPLQ